MEIKIYKGLPDDAMQVRQTVFVKEQGFCDEFDETDKIATHLVAYDNETPVGTCRFFTGEKDGEFLLGRLAVIKEYRKNHLGAAIMNKAQEFIKNDGGKLIRLHAQEQAMNFYKKLGYTVCSDMEYEEHCPHYWMQKKI